MDKNEQYQILRRIQNIDTMLRSQHNGADAHLINTLRHQSELLKVAVGDLELQAALDIVKSIEGSLVTLFKRRYGR